MSIEKQLSDLDTNLGALNAAVVSLTKAITLAEDGVNALSLPQVDEAPKAKTKAKVKAKPEPEPKTPEPKAEASRAEPEAQAPEPTGTDEESNPISAHSGKSMNREYLRAIGKKALEDGHAPKIREFLGEKGVGRITELKSEHWQEFEDLVIEWTNSN